MKKMFIVGVCVGVSGVWLRRRAARRLAESLAIAEAVRVVGDRLAVIQPLYGREGLSLQEFQHLIDAQRRMRPDSGLYEE
jgi:hypothetical protein